MGAKLTPEEVQEEEARKRVAGELAARAAAGKDAANVPKAEGADEVDGQGFEIFFNPGEPAKLSTGDRMVHQMNIGQVIDFCAVAEPIIPELALYLRNREIPLTRMLAQHGNLLLQSVAAATGIPLAELKVMSTDDFLLLAGKTIVVNVDFFLHRLRVLYAELRNAADRALAEAAKKESLALSAGQPSSTP